jgi:hypothetical protein
MSLLPPQEKEFLLKGSSKTAVAEGSYSERLDSDKNGVWIRSFLINTQRNARGWAVAPSTILQNVYSIVGKPLVLDQDPQTGKADHPQWDSTRSADANFREQSKKAIALSFLVSPNRNLMNHLQRFLTHFLLSLSSA